MSALLILGSKPDPALPPRSSYDTVACANASGFSAATHHLPRPKFTVMSAILPVVESGRQSLKVLAGLGTETLYFYPRPPERRNIFKQAKRVLIIIRTQPFYLRRILRSLRYEYGQFVDRSHGFYDSMIKNLCDHDEMILQQIKRKQPSTGIMALAIGLAEQKYDRYIISGFSFELTHAYSTNPEIEQRGSKVSGHAETDTTVMGYLANKFGNVFTTEPTVHERAGVPFLPADAKADG